MTPAAARIAPQPPPILTVFTELLEQALAESGYVHNSTRIKLRRLIRRMNLNAHDAETWLGIRRQILRKFSTAVDPPRK